MKLMKVINYCKLFTVITITLIIAMKTKITVFKIRLLKPTLRCLLSILKNYLSQHIYIIFHGRPKYYRP